MLTQTMAAITGALLTIYIVGILIALIVPPKRRDPHDGMARGCLMFVILGLVAVGIVLIIGVTADIPWMVHVPFYMTVYPTAMLLISIVVRAWKRWKHRR